MMQKTWWREITTVDRGAMPETVSLKHAINICRYNRFSGGIKLYMRDITPGSDFGYHYALEWPGGGHIRIINAALNGIPVSAFPEGTRFVGPGVDVSQWCQDRKATTT